MYLRWTYFRILMSRCRNAFQEVCLGFCVGKVGIEHELLAIRHGHPSHRIPRRSWLQLWWSHDFVWIANRPKLTGFDHTHPRLSWSLVHRQLSLNMRQIQKSWVALSGCQHPQTFEPSFDCESSDKSLLTFRQPLARHCLLHSHYTCLTRLNNNRNDHLICGPFALFY